MAQLVGQVLGAAEEAVMMGRCLKCMKSGKSLHGLAGEHHPDTQKNSEDVGTHNCLLLVQPMFSWGRER